MFVLRLAGLGRRSYFLQSAQRRFVSLQRALGVLSADDSDLRESIGLGNLIDGMAIFGRCSIDFSLPFHRLLTRA